MREISRPTPEEISAYLDGELDAERSAEVSYYLSTDTKAAQDAARQKALSDGLRTLGRTKELGDMPSSVVMALESLRDASPQTLSPKSAVRRPTLVAIAAGIAAIILVGVFLVPRIGGLAPGETEIAADVLYFLDLGAERAEFGPREQAAISRTLVGFDVALRDTPRLRQAGFTLTGGRLIAKDGQGAVLLFYRARGGSPVGLLISVGATQPVTSFDPALSNANAIYWREGTFSFAAVGRQTTAELQAFQVAFESR